MADVGPVALSAVQQAEPQRDELPLRLSQVDERWGGQPPRQEETMARYITEGRKILDTKNGNRVVKICVTAEQATVDAYNLNKNDRMRSRRY